MVLNWKIFYYVIWNFCLQQVFCWQELPKLGISFNGGKTFSSRDYTASAGEYTEVYQQLD